MPLPPLLREPLLHFVALGALVFAVHAGLGGSLTARAPGTIVVDAGVRARLTAEHERREGRAPTDPELEAALDAWIADAALVAEARALGLDRGDAMVERRLAQKMEFLLGTEVNPPAPSDDELRALLDPTPEPPTLRVEHRVFRADRPDPRGDADAAVVALTRGDPAPGDPFIHGLLVRGTPSDLDARFGPGFAARLPSGDGWGVAESRFGVHAVRVAERVEPPAPTLEGRRPVLERAWREARREALLEARTRALVARYAVVRSDR